MELILDTQWRSKCVNVCAAAISLEILLVFQKKLSMKSEGLRVCLWGIFESGCSGYVVQLLDDWWSESRRSCEAPSSPGGNEPRRMALQH